MGGAVGGSHVPASNAGILLWVKVSALPWAGRHREGLEGVPREAQGAVALEGREALVEGASPARVPARAPPLFVSFFLAFPPSLAIKT